MSEIGYNYWFWKTVTFKSTVFFIVVLICVGCDSSIRQYQTVERGRYLGAENCKSCHQEEYSDWRRSHHDKSMQIANETTVLGDFNDSEFESNGVTSKFFRFEDKYFVNTEGPDGEIDDFEVSYSFGVSPLQQYMVEMKDGKIQCLLIAWDTEKQQWFDLIPDIRPSTDDWMHWTKSSMTWNTMCADCHSTGLKKNYDELSKSYNTTYDIINVSCEACHGPGETHVTYVNSEAYQEGERINGSLMYQPLEQDKKELVNECARCHSRRGPVTEYFDHDGTFLDHYLPSVVAPALYYLDGQILEEVYVYGSFLQSKMYDRNVSCIDCHNPHSLELKYEGNTLCTQCHVADKYDTPDHHFHESRTEGSKCISCHMPGRIYMGNDYRRDHSFRVPRPDLSNKYGTPNACNDCHSEQSFEWSEMAIEEWYGDERVSHFSEILAAAHSGDLTSLPGLISMVGDTSIPDIIQASAVQILGDVNIQESRQKIINALNHENAFVRHAAVSAISNYPKDERLMILPSLLSDSVRTVRIQTAYVLADIEINELQNDFQQDYLMANEELKTCFSVQADYPGGQLMKGIYYQMKGQYIKAEKAYMEASHLDPYLVQPYLNLANIKYLQGDYESALSLFNKSIGVDSFNIDAYYSIGLLHAEMKNLHGAEVALGKAAILSGNPRYYYNWGLSLQNLNKFKEAEKAYLKALEIETDSETYLYALSILYLQQNQKKKALKPLQKLLELNPTNQDYQGLFKSANN